MDCIAHSTFFGLKVQLTALVDDNVSYNHESSRIYLIIYKAKTYMKRLSYALLAACCGATPIPAAAADYMDGWNPQNFFEEVAECKKAIVFPAAADYVKRGIEKKQGERSLRNEVISMVPTFEAIATKVCYCALNEFAKDKPFGAKIGSDIAGYMQTPRCKAEMLSAMEDFKNAPGALKLR